MTLSDAALLFWSDARSRAVESLLADQALRRIRFSGLAGSSPAIMLFGLSENLRPSLVVADDPSAAAYLYNDLLHLAPQEDVAIFPSGYRRDIHFGQPDPPSAILRTDVLERLLSSKPPRWIVASPEALAEKVAPENEIRSDALRLAVGDSFSMDKIVDRLLELGFFSVDYVYEPGQFARRGSILDIYSFSSELPFRLDFFDDEIDSIRTFDVETQLSDSRLQSASVMPRGNATRRDGVSLLELLPDSSIIFCSSPEFIKSRIADIAARPISPSALIAEEGDPDAMAKVVDPASFATRFDSFRFVTFGNPGFPDSTPPQASLDFNCVPQALFHKNFDLIAESFSSFLNKGYELLILSDSPHQTERLRAIFDDRGDNIPFKPVLPTLHEGFVDHDRKLCFFTDHQIFDRFHNFTLRSDRARSGKLALSLRELNQIETGDYIVHIDHGIGRFGGLVKTEVNGRPQEMIKLFFQNNDLVLVSIHALHKLSKYRGKDGVPPKISKLGSGAWNRIKERTKSRLKDIARDLIRLYAARKTEQGFAFPPDSYLQNELEASFIYEDTPDQLKATKAIKADMESPRPMDRLICGDVGFGKTELAVRAAFKAADAGKQTALLVPTTVLAFQHYRTFSRRLADFPVRVEFLSRARKPKEVKQILADLEAGKIDILIGTHKLIGKSVKFKDLGLLIIDEEQKFGVAVKEKLKQLKVNIDTLTMSATPIPRTLQFSLMGARDLSSLNTPPANRHPVVTNVSSLDDEVIKEAIDFELSRNGQVFFVSNRIENLVELENKIRRLLPDARIIVAHGQMPPEKVEKAIIDFSNHDYDILLSTTIVENGIDMPNVNTILVNNADSFGLSELHQLRGRVGRSDKKAFCYLLVPPGKPLSPVARRRLQAIENFSDLGSGIHIAMQDLDIRGAGNLLGAEQSGFIADLGYEAYQQILRESVTELKTEEFADTFTDVSNGAPEEFVADVTVESDLELRLPPLYVPQENERITLYRRLDQMESPAAIESFREMLRDRFGPIPDTSEELIRIVPLRFAARRLGIERIVLKNGAMRLFFVPQENAAYYNSNAFGRVLAFIQANPRRCAFKNANGRNVVVISDVPRVSDALDILTQIEAQNPL
ncbi:MAG: transcription-repair coupling factor [Muribaculaceae bacterium]|nr:transcription-repair coupling factor [Muribaculaceae bacterium]